MKLDYEKLQYNEHKETNLILWLNTIATIGAFIILLIEIIK